LILLNLELILHAKRTLMLKIFRQKRSQKNGPLCTICNGRFGRSGNWRWIRFRELDKDRAGVIWGSELVDWNFPNRNVELAAGDGTPKFNLSLFQNDFRYCLWSYFNKIWFQRPQFATVSACASSTNALLMHLIILD
jgi:3-oxoacyl-[acyl-carrier-protein] synthase II